MKLTNVQNILYKSLIKYGAHIELDVFSYGYTTFINYLLYVMITLPITLILGVTTKTLVFLLFFIPLRRYIGGYHFDSKILCLVFSVFFSIIIPYQAIWIGQIHIYFRFTTLLIMIIVTLMVKVVDHPNKRVSVKEKLIYTRKSLEIEILYSILILIIYNNFTYLYLNIAYFSMAFCIIGILIARLKALRYDMGRNNA